MKPAIKVVTVLISIIVAAVWLGYGGGPKGDALPKVEFSKKIFGDPSLIYPTPDGKHFEQADEFLLFRNRTCDNLNIILMNSVRYKQPDLTAEAALKKCTANRLCQAVVCLLKGQCKLVVPTCILSNASVDTPSFVYVSQERVGQKLNLKKKLLSDLRSLSSIKGETTGTGGRELLLSKYSHADTEWNESLNNFTTRQQQQPPFITVTNIDLEKMRAPSVMVEPNNRLVFFFVPKAASKSILRLYDYLLGHRDVLLDKSDVLRLYLRNNDPHRERIPLSDLGVDVANQIMNDKRYRKVIFFRDVEQRALSSYLFLFGKNGLMGTHGTGSKVSNFKSFVNLLTTESDDPAEGTGPRSDIHYRKQVLLGNVFKFLPLFSFIGWSTDQHLKNFTSSYTSLNKSVSYQLISPPKVHTTSSAAKSRLYRFWGGEEKRILSAYTMDTMFFDHLGLKKGGQPVDGRNFPPFNSKCVNGSLTGSKQQPPSCWPGTVVGSN
eukprot:TRINITY_DN16512_c0_g1_i1.p1 TRINITY_DN16512_c0_g1~~TRINITY_DN16512_c0_g1_i1.p1  ORF type:complete len:511 (+),score=75.70 TRINITY_DN16512_c0_g1_i1:58-1533(+)